MTAPAAPPRLLRRGGRILADLAYKTFYHGPAWVADPAQPDANPHAVARRRIDTAIAAAMRDPGLNAILGQYFAGAAVTATALPSELLDDPRSDPSAAIDETDIRRIITALVPTRLAGLDFARTVINIVLQEYTPVRVVGLDERERPAGAPVGAGVPHDAPYSGLGLAGFHGSVPAAVAGTAVDVLYSVVVWSDGPIGIAVPGWQPWERITAILYHELQETRTNPDVDAAVRTGRSDLIGWNTDPLPGPDGIDCREIADLPLILTADAQAESFVRVQVAGPDGGPMTVPIQRLWSNRDGRSLP
jgi:hypothetical protein